MRFLEKLFGPKPVKDKQQISYQSMVRDEPNQLVIRRLTEIFPQYPNVGATARETSRSAHAASIVMRVPEISLDKKITQLQIEMTATAEYPVNIKTMLTKLAQDLGYQKAEMDANPPTEFFLLDNATLRTSFNNGTNQDIRVTAYVNTESFLDNLEILGDFQSLSPAAPGTIRLR